MNILYEEKEIAFYLSIEANGKNNKLNVCRTFTV